MFLCATTQILILSVIQRGALQSHCLQHWGRTQTTKKKPKPSRFFEKKEGSDSPETAKQHYEKMFIAAFEKNIECLENRFNQNGLEYYEALQQFLILAASKKNYDTELNKILGFYNNERSHDFDYD